MPVAIGVWSLVLEGGGPKDARKQIVPEADVVITNVALGDQVADEKSRTTVKLTYVGPASSDSEDEHDEDEVTGEAKTTVLCSLTPGKIEQASINVTLEAESEFLLQAVGKNTIYLTGNYIDQRGFDNDPYNDESESEEDAFALQDVSSDVEINPEDMDGIDDLSDDADRFEEIHDELQTKSAKRSRESDASEADTSAKSQKKKAKKQKAENGFAVPSAPESESQHKDKKKDKKDKKDKADGKDAKDDKGVMRELDRGLRVKDITIGTGPQAKTGNTVSMRYIGKLSNGKVFDSNTKGKPFTFKLGRREVIRGWDEGIKGMQVGGERLLIIPAELGYGQAKHGPIPGNSTLTFEVKLIEIK